MSEPSVSGGPRADLQAHLQRTLAPLQASFLAKQGPTSARATATLARLRSLDPQDPAQDPALYELIFERLPGSLTWRRDEPSRGELAMATALHLYATHQQGKPIAVHAHGVGFGASVRQLAQARSTTGTPNEGVVQRLGLLVRTAAPSMQLVHLRALIQQMRGVNVPLDYARLAVDVFDLHDPRTSSRVHLRWARDFHAQNSEAAHASAAAEGASEHTKETHQP